MPYITPATSSSVLPADSFEGSNGLPALASAVTSSPALAASALQTMPPISAAPPTPTSASPAIFLVLPALLSGFFSSGGCGVGMSETCFGCSGGGSGLVAKFGSVGGGVLVVVGGGVEVATLVGGGVGGLLVVV